MDAARSQSHHRSQHFLDTRQLCIRACIRRKDIDGLDDMEKKWKRLLRPSSGLWICALRTAFDLWFLWKYWFPWRFLERLFPMSSRVISVTVQHLTSSSVLLASNTNDLENAIELQQLAHISTRERSTMYLECTHKQLAADCRSCCFTDDVLSPQFDGHFTTHTVSSQTSCLCASH
jgi:hypothetical protein